MEVKTGWENVLKIGTAVLPTSPDTLRLADAPKSARRGKTSSLSTLYVHH